MPKIIQFLHSGVEASPEKGDSVIQWNNGANHKRKYMLSKGHYVLNEEIIEDELVFWGEWEPQSDIVDSWENAKPGFPKYLNSPYINPSVLNKKHNTDPYIFGDAFRYIICLQRAFPNVLQNIEAGSLILFGSCVEEQFCLDTLFVVSQKAIPYNFKELASFEKNIDTQGQYYHAAIVPMMSKPNKHNERAENEDDSCFVEDGEQFNLYFGVKYEDRENYGGMFSFVPSMINRTKFKRPNIKLDGIISQRKNQGVTCTDLSTEEVIKHWNAIKRQVEEEQLKLGVYFKSPTLK